MSLLSDFDMNQRLDMVYRTHIVVTDSKRVGKMDWLALRKIQQFLCIYRLYKEGGLWRRVLCG